MDIELNKSVALRFLDFAFKIRMAEAISMLTDDATWWVLGDPQKIRIAGQKNPAQTIRMMTRMHRALPHGMSHRVTGITAELDRVAVEVDAEGRRQDGRPYRNTYHFLLRVRGDKVAEIREYMDTMQVV